MAYLGHNWNLPPTLYTYVFHCYDEKRFTMSHLIKKNKFL